MNPKNDLIPTNKKLFEIQKIWRIRDVANYLGVTPGHIYNLVSRSEIPFIRKGRTIYFIPTEIEAWLLQGNDQ